MGKTEVYSWRLSPRLKVELEEAARAESKSIADLLDQIANDWLRLSGPAHTDEVERQNVLREAAMRFVGTIGGSPDRAESARTEVRWRIALRLVR